MKETVNKKAWHLRRALCFHYHLFYLPAYAWHIHCQPFTALQGRNNLLYTNFYNNYFLCLTRISTAVWIIEIVLQGNTVHTVASTRRIGHMQTFVNDNGVTLQLYLKSCFLGLLEVDKQLCCGKKYKQWLNDRNRFFRSLEFWMGFVAFFYLILYLWV